MALRIGIVIGEASGDTLGAGLIEAISKRFPDAKFEGVAGPRMEALGCKSFFDYERLAVMGYVEPLKRLPELLSLRKSLIDHFLKNPPDVFIGVDAPDFNLGIERKLKNKGIKTVHYVSPSVWAWRQYRIKKIAKSVDLMLTLFPFEAEFYKKHDVPVRFVGHTLADEIPLEIDVSTARGALGLEQGVTYIGLLPGSRRGEVSMLAEPFFETAKWCLAKNKELRFLVPLASDNTYQLAVEAMERSGIDKESVTFFRGNSRQVMAASNVVLIASGTATLEALLLKRPMIVAYRLSSIAFRLAKWLVKIPYVSLANLLAGRRLVNEYIQDDVVPEEMGQNILELLENEKKSEELQKAYIEVHQKLKCNADEKAAESVLNLLGR